jgi:HD-GYP domain-containing protein (c-di-GMP phosphodiesterase class II)
MLRLITNNKLHAYDPLVPDAYVLRLAAISKELGVFTAEDIFSAQGALLVREDVLLTAELTEVIRPHRLKKPIEQSIRLERELSSQALEQHFTAILQQDDLLSALNEHQNIVELIQHYFAYYDKFPLLKQKISVMAAAMPELFVRTIYCTWFAVVIAKEMRFSEIGCVEIFLAALSHDIGMLHLNIFVLEKRGQLTPEDWLHIQEHVFIGASLLRQMEGMPATVVEAVYEHHERCDGTGYPTESVESELSYAGKILGLADSVIAIYHNRFKNKQMSWREVIPVIQMNAQAYFYRHDEILTVIWRRSEMPFKNVVHGDKLPEFLAELLRERDYLTAWFEVQKESLVSLGFTHGDRHLHALQNVMLHLSSSVRGSGIFDEEMSQWLRSPDIANDEDAYRKIEKAHVQQQEIIFHLQRLNRMMQLYIDSENFKPAQIKEVLEGALARIKDLPR